MPKTVIDSSKRFPLNMRTTKAVRDKLEAAAHESGRSLTQEVEYRLARSFDVDDVRAAVREEFARQHESLWPFPNGAHGHPMKSRGTASLEYDARPS